MTTIRCPRCKEEASSEECVCLWCRTIDSGVDYEYEAGLDTDEIVNFMRGVWKPSQKDVARMCEGILSLVKKVEDKRNDVSTAQAETNRVKKWVGLYTQEIDRACVRMQVYRKAIRGHKAGTLSNAELYAVLGDDLEVFDAD